MISARDGAPVLAMFSTTCVAQITGTCAASHTQRILPAPPPGVPIGFNGEIAARNHYADLPAAHCL